MKVDATLPDLSALNLRDIVIEPEQVTITWVVQEDLPGGHGYVDVVRSYTYAMEELSKSDRGELGFVYGSLLARVQRDHAQKTQQNACLTCATSRCCFSENSLAVWCTAPEIDALAKARGMSRAKFEAEHIDWKPHWADPSLVGVLRRDGACPLLEYQGGQARCSVYAARPQPCRNGPERNCSLWEPKQSV